MRPALAIPLIIVVLFVLLATPLGLAIFHFMEAINNLMVAIIRLGLRLIGIN